MAAPSATASSPVKRRAVKISSLATAGTAGSGSAVSALTMQKTELTNLALDCELCIAQFTDANVTTIYERADQVDDTLKATKVKTTGVDVNASKKGNAIDKNDQSAAEHRIARRTDVHERARERRRYAG